LWYNQFNFRWMLWAIRCFIFDCHTHYANWMLDSTNNIIR
jgi:hypothetical protein